MVQSVEKEKKSMDSDSDDDTEFYVDSINSGPSPSLSSIPSPSIHLP